MHKKIVFFAILISLLLYSCDLRSIFGRSDEKTASIPQLLHGKVDIPLDSGISLALVDIVVGLNEIPNEKDGEYTVPVTLETPTIGFVTGKAGEVYLANILSDGKYSSDLSVQTTAVTAVFYGSGLFTIDPSLYSETMRIIQTLHSVIEFGSLLANKIRTDSDTFRLISEDEGLHSAYTTAIEEALRNESIIALIKVGIEYSKEIDIGGGTQSGVTLSIDEPDRVLATNSEPRCAVALITGPGANGFKTLLPPRGPLVDIPPYKPSETYINPNPIPFPNTGEKFLYTIRVSGGLRNSGQFVPDLDQDAWTEAIATSIIYNVIIPIFSMAVGMDFDADIMLKLATIILPYTVTLRNWIINNRDSDFSFSMVTDLVNQMSNTVDNNSLPIFKELVLSVPKRLLHDPDEYSKAAKKIFNVFRYLNVITNSVKVITGLESLFNTNRVDVFSLENPLVFTPVFEPSGGTYDRGQKIKISTRTLGATIHYLFGEGIPSRTSGAIIESGDSVTLTEDCQINAIAYKNGFADSSVRKGIFTITTTTTIPASIQMGSISGGSFQMGSLPGVGSDNERPVHSVTLTGFQMGIFEITQALYQEIVGSNPSNFSSGVDAPNRPVEAVSWYDAVEFCNKLSAKDGYQPVYSITARTPSSGNPITSAIVEMDITKNGYRLPTESEWEYAARGGDGSPGGYIYSGSNDIDAVAWWAHSENPTHPVGGKLPNGLGLYDMTGNVLEWCQDWYGGYESSLQTDPLGLPSGTSRILRGGSKFHMASGCRSSYRGDISSPGLRGPVMGFRVVRRP